MIIEFRRDTHANKNGMNYARLLMRWMLCLPLITLHQIIENVLGEMIFMRNGFHNETNKVKKFITIGVKILLLY